MVLNGTGKKKLKEKKKSKGKKLNTTEIFTKASTRDNDRTTNERFPLFDAHTCRSFDISAFLLVLLCACVRTASSSKAAYVPSFSVAE